MKIIGGIGMFTIRRESWFDENKIFVYFTKGNNTGLIIDDDKKIVNESNFSAFGIEFFVTSNGVFPNTSAGKAIYEYVRSRGEVFRYYEIIIGSHHKPRIYLPQTKLYFDISANPTTVNKILDKYFTYLSNYALHDNELHDVIKELETVYDKEEILRKMPGEMVVTPKYYTWIKVSLQNYRVEFTTPSDDYYNFPNQFVLLFKKYPEKYPARFSVKTASGERSLHFIPQPIMFSNVVSPIKAPNDGIESEYLFPSVTVRNKNGSFIYDSPQNYIASTPNIIVERQGDTIRYHRATPEKDYMTSYSGAKITTKDKNPTYYNVHLKNGSFAVALKEIGDIIYMHAAFTREGIFTLAVYRDYLKEDSPISIFDEGVYSLFTHIPFPRQILFSKSSIMYNNASTPAVKLFIDGKQLIELKKNAMVSQNSILRKIERNKDGGEVVSEFGII